MNDNHFLILILFSGTLLLALFALFIITYLLVQKQKQNAYQLEKSSMIYNHQNKILLTRVEEQEKTMDQISKEIHDNVGQLLNFMKMNIYAIEHLSTSENQLKIIDKTKQLLDHVIRDVHSISHSLNSEFIKSKGLFTALEEELEYITFSHDLVCKVNETGKHKTFSPDKELLIFRIAQEAIHNITKHAQATAINISLDYGENTFVMKIADNGIGFEKQKIYDLNGIGFLNMFHRAKLMNGTLDIETKPSYGCVITLRLENEDNSNSTAS